MAAAEIDIPSIGGDAVFREQQVAQSVLVGVVVDIRRLVVLAETEADETTVGRQPQVALVVLGNGEDAVAVEVIVAVFRLKAVVGGIVEKEAAAVGDCPQSAGMVLQTIGGVVDSEVALLRGILLHAHTSLPSIGFGDADDALVVCGQPDVALPVLADAPDVAVRDVAPALAERDGKAAAVGQHHAQPVALAYPHDAVARFIQRVDKVLFDPRRVGLVEHEGFTLCLLDDDTIVVVGEPQVAVASLYDAREARCQRVFRDRTETRDGLVDLCCARLPVIACDAIGIESQPKSVAVGREERADKVDGEGTWTGLQVIALKWRAVEGRLNDAIVLSEYPDIAAEVSGHPIAIVQAGAVDVGEIGGVKYKLMGAVSSNADIFFVPSENYDEAIKTKNRFNYKINIIKVETLQDAINYLQNN